MTKLVKSIACAYFLSLTLSSAAQFRPAGELDLPKFDVLPRMSTEWVAENLKYNGMPASIRNFKSPDSVDEVFTAYERKWRTRGFNKVAHSKFGDMRTLGIENGDHYYTVQARKLASGGSEGSLIVSLTPLEAKAGASTEFPLYPNSEIMSVIESNDVGMNAETIVSTNSSSISSNAHWITSSLERDGWVSQQFGMPSTDFKVRQLNFQKQRQLCQVTIVANNPGFEGKTAVIVNWMK